MTFSPAGLARSLATGLVDWANPISRDSGLTFDPGTSISPPHGGRSSWVHYGVMVPNLPAPHNSFGIMSIIGTPGVEVFANDQAITTNPRDT
ncbi:MAG TPA: hypothetical protein PLC19_10615, partial [Marmoricola sp.]|nr:hypothetical protein [Marmoricola sp.]